MKLKKFLGKYCLGIAFRVSIYELVDSKNGIYEKRLYAKQVFSDSLINSGICDSLLNMRVVSIRPTDSELIIEVEEGKE